MNREVRMNQTRGILCLNEAPYRAAQKHTNLAQRLIFHENEPLLSQVQTALWQLRLSCEWVCVAAEGGEALAALALAAQLPVDRLALKGVWLNLPRRGREMARLRRYALRNLPLVISDALLIGAPEEEIKILLRSRRHGGLCALEAQDWSQCAQLLTAPWDRATENNLLIPMKCV